MPKSLPRKHLGNYRTTPLPRLVVRGPEKSFLRLTPLPAKPAPPGYKRLLTTANRWYRMTVEYHAACSQPVTPRNFQPKVKS